MLANSAMPALPQSNRKDAAKAYSDAAQQLRVQAQRETNLKDGDNAANTFNWAGTLEQARELVLEDEKSFGKPGTRPFPAQ